MRKTSRGTNCPLTLLCRRPGSGGGLATQRGAERALTRAAQARAEKELRQSGTSSTGWNSLASSSAGRAAARGRALPCAGDRPSWPRWGSVQEPIGSRTLLSERLTRRFECSGMVSDNCELVGPQLQAPHMLIGGCASRSANHRRS